jgi:predicted  nucleic acid-binding Zn-ribbon protein
MQHVKTAILMTFAATLSASALASPAAGPVATPVAGPVVTKDWSFDASTCVASTTAKTAAIKTTDFRLEVAIDPAHERPLEVRIVPSADVQSGLQTPLLGAILALDRRTSYAFAPLTSETSVPTLWNVPRGTLALMSFLKREAKVSVTLLDGAKGLSLSFSLKGSSAALAALQKQCNGAQEFGADGFERAFLPAVVANVDPTKLQAADTAKLRDLVKTALAAFRSSNDTQAQLNYLSSQYLTQIAEYEQLRTNLDKLTHDTVVRLTKRRIDAQANIDRANVEIPQLKAQVVTQEAALAPANAALDQATNDLAPLISALRNYQNAVDDADSRVSSAEQDLSQAQTYEAQVRSRLQEIINGTAQSAANISSLQNHIASLRNDLINANNYTDQWRRYYSDAQSNRQRFNKFSEVQRRLSSDSRLSSIESQLRDAQNRIPGAQAHISQAEADRSRFNGELHLCQATPGKDCSHELDLSNRAEQRMQQAQNEFNGLQNSISSLRSQKDNFRQTIEREVEGDYNALVRTEQDAQSKYSDAQSQANQIVSQISQLQNNDLPQAQSNLSSWQNARLQADSDVRSAVNGTASAQRNLSAANSDLENAQSRRDSWKSSSGYNAKARAANSAQDAVDTIKSTLNQLDRGIASREKVIRDETKSLADTEVQMQAALAAIKQKEDRSGEVQKILAPYFQQLDLLAAQKAASDQAFTDSQAAFAAGL